MARILTTGFELNSTTSGVEWDTYSGATISSTTKRSGSYGLRINAAASTPFWRAQVYSADSSSNVAYLRFYLYIASAPSVDSQICRIVNSSNVQQAVLRLTTTSKLQLLNGSVVQVGSDSSALSASTWYRVELKWDPATGATDARIDGTSFASGTGTTGSWSRILLGIPTGTPNCDLFFDDVALNDSTGSNQTSWPGDGKVIYLRPNAAGDANDFGTQTGGTAGASNNYTRVNEVTPNDATSYNGSSTLNHEDIFNVDSSGIGASDTVNVVHVNLRFRNGVAADATTAIKAEAKKTSGGTTAQSSAIIPNQTGWRTNSSTAPYSHPLTLYADPDGSAWTQSTLDSMQIGYKLTAVGTRSIHVTSAYAIVDYTPSAGTQSSTTQDVRATGESTSNTTRDARVTGQSTSSITSDVRTTGEATSSHAIDTRTTGQATASADRDTRLIGSLTSATTTDSRLTGEASSSTTVDVRATGAASTSHTADAHLVGQADTSTSTDTRTTGELTSSTSFSVLTVGAATSQDSRHVRVTGEATSSTTRDVNATGQSTSTHTADVRATGIDAGTTAADSRDVRTTGEATSSTDQGVRLTAQASSDSATDVRVTGQDSAGMTVDARTTGQAASAYQQPIYATGQLTAAAELPVRTTGQATTNRATDMRLTGTATAATSQDVRLTASRVIRYHVDADGKLHLVMQDRGTYFINEDGNDVLY